MDTLDTLAPRAGCKAGGDIFFVLSGFVLTLSLKKGKQGYASFIVRRFCRIYLPFAVAILLAQTICVLIEPTRIPELQEPIASDWSDYSLGTFLRHFLMLGFANDIQLDGVMWSLTHEMRMAFLMPLLVPLFAWRTKSCLAASLLLSVCAVEFLSFMGQQQLFTPESLSAVGLLTAYYLFPFALGISIALHWKWLMEHVSQRLFGFTLVIVCVSGLIQRPQIAQFGLNDFPIALIAGALIILTLASSRLDRALTNTPIQWLGAVSYSLYLTHLIVIQTSLHLLSAKIGIFASVIIALPLAFAVAHVFNRLVEKPSAKLALYR